MNGSCLNSGNEVNAANNGIQNINSNQVTHPNKDKKNSNKLMFIIVGILLVISIIAFSIIIPRMVNSSDAKKTAMKFCEATGNHDGDILVELLLLNPSQEEIDELRERAKSRKEVEEMDNIKFVSCEIISAKRLDRNAKEVFEYLMSPNFTEEKITIEVGVKVNLNFKRDVDGEIEEEEISVTAYKIKDRWYATE